MGVPPKTPRFSDVFVPRAPFNANFTRFARHFLDLSRKAIIVGDGMIRLSAIREHIYLELLNRHSV